ncbi:hypothetical protein J6590_103400 [Homalodisca vitripennis]|nr:hypothetical protein J6590_103400 [Homalodisca vitripennis]
MKILLYGSSREESKMAAYKAGRTARTAQSGQGLNLRCAISNSDPKSDVLDRSAIGIPKLKQLLCVRISSKRLLWERLLTDYSRLYR